MGYPIWGMAVGLVLGCGGAGAEGVQLAVSIRARALAAGEPVRVEAVASAPLEALEGEFLGRAVFMTRLAAGTARDERWSGWSLVPLSQRGGPATVELHGRTRDGRPVTAALMATIVDREFPEERLAVEPRYVEPEPADAERIARERAKLAAIYARQGAPESPLAPFVRPAPGEPTSIFGLRRVYNGEPRSPHPGLDLRAATGTPVAAAGTGRVVLAEDLYYSGNTVILDHGGGLFTIYAHLSRIGVRAGESARAGQQVGLSGATGRVTGPHLHWGAKIGDAPFDPTALLDAALWP